MAQNRDLSFVIITYNDAAKLGRAISSAALAAKAGGLDYEILVADNGSADHTAGLLAEFGRLLGPRLVTIALDRNTGTTYPRNLAMSQSRGNFICVMDSDAEILDHGLPRVLRMLADFAEVGIAGPRIIMPDGSTYDSAKKLPTLSDKLLKIPGVLLRRPTINRDWYPDFPFTRPTPVQSVISCCWFFRRDLFSRIGPLDENIFYAPEDVDWCLRCWLAERAVVYYPGLRVLHHTKQVSHKSPFSFTARSHMKGLLYYFHKHGYWFSRKRLVDGHILPLAEKLGPALLEWESKEGQAPSAERRPFPGRAQ